jgi:hypothetical protein
VIVRCARRGVPVVDVVALAMLIVLGLAPAISDQYLMWPIAILLLGGHHRIVALLSAALTPAIVLIDISSATNGPAVPTAPLLLATLATIVAAGALWRETRTYRPASSASAIPERTVAGST